MPSRKQAPRSSTSSGRPIRTPTLSTSGPDVGLPHGQMGNSEVGHLNLGAGAIVKQDLARIDDSIADGSFFENPALRGACGAARESRRGRLHAIGLVSDGGVHSGWEHIEAVIELAGEEGVSDLVLHVLTDGRDTLPTNGAGYVEEVERWLRHTGRIGTVGWTLLGDGPRPPLGSDEARLRRDRPRPGATRGLRRRGDPRVLRARDHRRVHRAGGDRGLRRRRVRTSRSSSSTSGPTGPGSSPGRSATRTSTSSTGAAPRRSR